MTIVDSITYNNNSNKYNGNNNSISITSDNGKTKN